MVSKTITLNFVDANEADIVAALKANAATRDNPSPTKAQAWDWFETSCKSALKDVVKRHKRDDAVRIAEAAVSTVDIT